MERKLRKNYWREHNEVMDNFDASANFDDEPADAEGMNPVSSKPTKDNASKSDTPALDSFGRDLTKLATEGKIDPIIGRDREISRVAQILGRRKKNNVLLIGDAGVGKTAIGEGLALRISQKKVSRTLFDKRIVSLDLGSIVAGTKYRGQFEERMKVIMQELADNPNIILFIDEIHTIVGAGGSTGSLDAANMFKPALARGEIQCIGATTLDEYRENIEKDGALDRRFQRVMVDATTVDETKEILDNIKVFYEDFHRVEYTDDAINQCVILAERYITDRAFPDKAIDILDEAGSRVHIDNIQVPETIVKLEEEIEAVIQEKNDVVKAQQYEAAARLRDKEVELKDELEKAKLDWEEELKKHRETVTGDNIADVVSIMTGIPVSKVGEDEATKILKLDQNLKEVVIGQDNAIHKIAKAIRRSRVGLKRKTKPIGSFIFLGPTGVGKTYLAKMLAKELFDNEDNMIRVDMSEYQEKFSISRLVGAPPGYVGYEKGGSDFSEKVRRKPYSVVLLDEVEKAHPDVFNVLLQVLDEGHLTDSLGRKVNFKNTVLIMTSNIGVKELAQRGTSFGFQTGNQEEQENEAQKEFLKKKLKGHFSPEFLNRVDDVVIFNSLRKKELHKIIDLNMKDLKERVSELGFSIDLTEEAKNFLLDKGYDKEYGARPLNRAIERYIEDVLAEEMLSGNVPEGSKVTLDVAEDKKSLSVSKIEK